MSASKRKDEHIKYALESKHQVNDFDFVELEHFSIPKISFDDVSLKTTFLDFESSYPFYINAMTGGSKQASVINEKLAFYAKTFNIPLILGSQSAALKDPGLVYSYEVARKINNQGYIVANVNANASIADAKLAIEMINANALSIHINVIQEVVMDEGDRDFTKWQENIKNIVSNIDVPVLVKEVGFGMSRLTIEKLIALGVKYVDVSGKGGTNFALIENKRKGLECSVFNELGISTVKSLKNAEDLGVITYASGGIRNALDIFKALTLGAKAVGLSKYFLELTKLPNEEAVDIINSLIKELKKLFIVFNKRSLNDF